MVKKVLKFGGTSVGSIDRVQHVAKIIEKEHKNGNQLIVVVSAMSGKTNELLNLSKNILDSSGGQSTTNTPSTPTSAALSAK